MVRGQSHPLRVEILSRRRRVHLRSRRPVGEAVGVIMKRAQWTGLGLVYYSWQVLICAQVGVGVAPSDKTSRIKSLGTFSSPVPSNARAATASSKARRTTSPLAIAR